MRPSITALAVALMVVLAQPAAATDTKGSGGAGEVVIADRASGTISVIENESPTHPTRTETPVYQGFRVVGATGIEPVTSAV